MKTCYFCRGPVEARTIDYMARRGDTYTLVKGLRAEVCGQCGEIYLGIEASKAIDRALDETGASKESVVVPVVRFGVG